MIQYLWNADIFASKADALVNPVNCLGVMGKGLARQFGERYPQECHAYYQWCKDGLARPGRVLASMIREQKITDPRTRFIIHFPTKNDWRQKSQLEFISSGLAALVETVHELDLERVAVPALGCGAGGLPWAAVKALMIAHLEGDLNHTRWDVYPPHD